MPFKTILAIIQTNDDVERVLDCAIGLAGDFDSHVIGLHSEALPMPYTSAVGFPDTEFLQITVEANKERADRLQSVFNTRMQETGIPFEWRSLESFSGDSAISGVSSARSADLVLVAQANPEGESGVAIDVDALLFDAGRPVLITPHAGPTLHTFRKVLIAWNGSKEAARATFDALPFIENAERTEILVIDPPDSYEEDSATAGTEIAAALTRHGAKVSVVTEKTDGSSVEEVIKSRIAETDADLLVLGAYTHSWFRQFLFGGTTRSVLQSMPIATLLSR
ncbi:universal stress protein [Mesorhizobium sp. SB112]|uniref:universal stress protein n=1 Tax=Mesorhizobium sp. SB112 TaxID=3151853 RepID=UPI003264FA43